MQPAAAKTLSHTTPTSSIFLDTAIGDAHLEVRDLYLECLSHVLVPGSFNVHVLINPDMDGHHVLYGADEEDLAEEVTALTGVEVELMDCIVVLGRGMLGGNLTEDEMAVIVSGDISSHIVRLWPVADRSVGWVGKQIGWSAVAGMVVSAHPVLSAMPLSGRGPTLHQRIRDAAAEDMRAAMYPGKGGMDLMKRENGAALQAVDLVLSATRETFGGYISLPASASDLVEAGKRLVCNVLDDMDVRPVGVV